MKFIFCIATYIILLNAQTPSTYSTLGDIIYNNSSKIDNLKKIKVYKKYKNRLKRYKYKLNQVKIYGYDIETGYRGKDDKVYINKLKSLSKENDFFTRTVKNNFLDSLENNKITLFVQMVNSGLLDIPRYKEDILNFYLKNKKHIRVSGNLKKLLINDKKLKRVLGRKLIKDNKKLNNQIKKIKSFSKSVETKSDAIKTTINQKIEKP